MISLLITEDEANTLVGLLESLRAHALEQTREYVDPRHLFNQVATKQYHVASAVLYKIKLAKETVGNSLPSNLTPNE
jgi:hypothetical protein